MAALEMTALNRELVYLTLQFLNEAGYKETARMLEQESGYYFHMDYFEEMVLSGQWEAAERYLSGFTRYDDNRYSRKVYFEMRKENFLETLDRNDSAMALDILIRDLKVFAAYDEELFKEMTQLLSLCNIREKRSLSGYKDPLSSRAITMAELKKIIQANPIFRGKLRFPPMEHRRLQILINQGLNWQHRLCLNPLQYPQINTILTDHVCGLPGDSVSQPLLVQSSTPSTVTHPVAPTVVVSVHSGEGGAEKWETVDNDEVTSAGPVAKDDKVHEEKLLLYKPTDLPTIVIKTFDVDSFPTSIEFHPTMQSVLLVGAGMGDISIWEVRSGDRLFSRNFEVWGISLCTMAFKTSMVKDPQVSVNRITWSPDGSLFGAAFSKHLVQLYSYPSDTKIKQHLEIDAHAGAVTDLAFSAPEEHLLLITCGDDKIIKVWDAMSGEHKFSLEGHSALICSVCPHSKDGVDFIFSTSADGNIKAWLYDEIGARVDYHAPGLGHITMAYSELSSSRLFSCGTNLEGESFLVEWDETEGSVKRMYKGLARNYLDVLQLTTGNNKYLAVGDDFVIKFWHMDHDDVVISINAGGGLPARPKVRFNQEGSLLAVIAVGCTIKILGSGVGTDLIPQRQEAAHAISSYKVISETLKKHKINRNLTISNPKGAKAVKEIPKKDRDSRNQEEMKPQDLVDEEDLNLKFYHAYEPSHCLSMQLSSDLKTAKILRLVYTNSGKAILALTSDADHLLWKWQRSDLNPSGMATANVSPPLWQPKGSQLMMNHHNEIPLSRVIPCFALSKNDCYLVSASGGEISLFNTVSFKTITTFMSPPPSATCIAFYPQDNNIVAIGMDNATIVIYHVREDRIITRLEGHFDRVTGLTFSTTLDVLVSCGGDLQIIQWEVQGWAIQKAELFQPRSPSLPPSWFDTTAQFDKDQRRFLAVNSTKLAIYDGKDLSVQAMWPHAAVFPGPVFSSFGDYTTEITNAVFSCDGRMIYAGFSDGSVGVFETKTLDLAYQISEASYIPQPMRSNVFLTVVAAHPKIPTQFVAGLSDGRVYIVEPAPGDVTVWSQLALDEKEHGEGSILKNQGPISEYCDSSGST